MSRRASDGAHRGTSKRRCTRERIRGIRRTGSDRARPEQRRTRPRAAAISPGRHIQGRGRGGWGGDKPDGRLDRRCRARRLPGDTSRRPRNIPADGGTDLDQERGPRGVGPARQQEELADAGRATDAQAGLCGSRRPAGGRSAGCSGRCGVDYPAGLRRTRTWRPAIPGTPVANRHYSRN